MLFINSWPMFVFFRLQLLQCSLISCDRSRISFYRFLHIFLLSVVLCPTSSSHTLEYFLLEGPLGSRTLSASVVVVFSDFNPKTHPHLQYTGSRGIPVLLRRLRGWQRITFISCLFFKAVPYSHAFGYASMLAFRGPRSTSTIWLIASLSNISVIQCFYLMV